MEGFNKNSSLDFYYRVFLTKISSIQGLFEIKALLSHRPVLEIFQKNIRQYR